MELAELLNLCKGENMYYIGNHLPVSKGYAVMGEMALKLGGNTFAFFTRNPRGGKAKEIDEDDVNELLNITEENGFGKLFSGEHLIGGGGEKIQKFQFLRRHIHMGAPVED